MDRETGKWVLACVGRKALYVIFTLFCEKKNRCRSLFYKQYMSLFSGTCVTTICVEETGW